MFNLRRYNTSLFVSDLLAGISVAILIVPHSIAQAALAGMPPEAGLYSAIAAPIIYGLFGSSRTMAVGPVALTAIISATGVAALDLETTEAYIAAIAGVTLIAGAVQIGMGLLHAGSLTRYLSKPMLSGLLTAIALIIVLNEVDHLTGVEAPRQASTVQLVSELIRQVGEIDIPSLLLGITSIGVLLLLRHLLEPALARTELPEWFKTLMAKSGPLLVVLLGVVVIAGLGLDSVPLVGSFPAGLPPLRLPELDWTLLPRVAQTGVTVGLLAYVQSMIMANNLAERRGQRIDADRDLFALGFANMASGLTGGFAVAGSVSRSMVNFSAGARTGGASILTGIILALSVIYLANWFQYLAYPSLAAIIMVAVSSLVEFRTLWRLFQNARAEAVIWLVTFAVVLIVGIELGLLAGVLVSVGWAGIQTWRCPLRIECINAPCEHIILLNVTGCINLLNVDKLLRYLRRVTVAEKTINDIVIDCHAIREIDLTSSDRINSKGAEQTQFIIHLADLPSDEEHGDVPRTLGQILAALSCK